MRRPPLPLAAPLAAASLLAACAAAPPPPAPRPAAALPAAEPPSRAADVEVHRADDGTACPPDCIPGTGIPASKENVDAIALCERYRRAVVEKDVPLLISLASPSYSSGGGTPDEIDDIDYAGLTEYLRTQFVHYEEIRYEIQYQRIFREDDMIHVDYTYTASYRRAGAAAPQTLASENRLSLVRGASGFLIVSGM